MHASDFLTRFPLFSSQLLRFKFTMEGMMVCGYVVEPYIMRWSSQKYEYVWFIVRLFCCQSITYLLRWKYTGPVGYILKFFKLQTPPEEANTERSASPMPAGKGQRLQSFGCILRGGITCFGIQCSITQFFRNAPESFAYGEKKGQTVLF